MAPLPPAPRERGARVALAVVLALHVLATCVLLPPWEALRPEPLRFIDHSVHTYRVYIYREALRRSGAPWGWDPAVAAGEVTEPYHDAGAKPQQVLGALLPFLPPGAVVRLFLFLAALTIPLGTLFACRALGIPTATRVWVLVALLGPAWLYDNLPRYFLWGLASFTAAAYLTPLVLARFLVLLERPRLRPYAAFVLAATILFLLHVAGPVVLVLPLALLVLLARPLPARWRLAALLAPAVVLALNAFWFVPLLRERAVLPRGSTSFIEGLERPDMTYRALGELAEVLAGSRWVVLAVACALAGAGLARLAALAGRRAALGFALAAASAVTLKFFGSFLPVIVLFQPARFLVPSVALLAIPVGLALADLAGRARLPRAWSAAAVALVLAAAAALLGKPESVALPPSPDPLAEFVARRTTPAERLLIQSRHVNDRVHILALAFAREVIGTTYPDLADPAQFLGRVLWGRTLDRWSPPALRAALTRWGVTWVFTATEEARALFARTVGGPGERVDHYVAFRTLVAPTRFLVGRGRVDAAVNRLALAGLRPDHGLVVLRYRYHPGWRAPDGVRLEPYPVPEDPAGFIALRDPPAAVTLTFDPWVVLRTRWVD